MNNILQELLSAQADTESLDSQIAILRAENQVDTENKMRLADLDAAFRLPMGKFGPPALDALDMIEKKTMGDPRQILGIAAGRAAKIERSPSAIVSMLRSIADLLEQR